MDWENQLEKNPIQKIEKIVKIEVKLPQVNKKPQARKRIFVPTPLSHSTLKLERKKFTPQNHSLFRSTSCFEHGWTDLKKRQGHNTIHWIVKNSKQQTLKRRMRTKNTNQDNELPTEHVFLLRS